MPHLPYFPFTIHDDKPQVGLKPLALQDWIEIDEHWDTHIRMKSEIVRDHRTTVLQALPGSEESCLELRDVLAEHLATRFPERFKLDSNTLTTPKNKVFAPTQEAEQALEQISQWTQEDWAILSAKPPVRLEAGVICFPSRWSLAEKIGLDSGGIHGPVPKYETIAKPTQSFLERLTVDRPMWRLNWTIHDSDILFCPAPHPSKGGLTAENILDKTWLRVERQTLRRLPKTGAAVFSIRTYLHLMNDVVDTPERIHQVHSSLMALSDESAAYKGMRQFHHILKSVLSSKI